MLIINNIIRIKGARQHNLKNISLDIPKNKLVIFTGLSGSGKSSLAFNTIYAEGRKRYIDSLSAYARQFLGNSDKADVDIIEGLSPAISIDQKSTSQNPRSTVGTTTEIYDYLRLLYAKIGIPYCINGHGVINNISLNEVINIINSKFNNKDKLLILSPIIRNEKGSFDALFLRLKKEGFIRFIVDGDIHHIDQKLFLDKNILHNIDIVIDRITLEKEDKETQSRLFEDIENASKYSNGLIKIKNKSIDVNNEFLFSQNFACIKCNYSFSELEPRIFSFNSPAGACESCNGIGIRLEVDKKLLIPNSNLSILDGGISYFSYNVDPNTYEWKKFMYLLNFYNIDPNKPIKDFSDFELSIILSGSNERIKLQFQVGNFSVNKFDYIEGIAALIKRRYLETKSEKSRQYYKKFMTNKICNTCKGDRLDKKNLFVLIDELNIIDFTKLPLNEAYLKIKNLKLSKTKTKIAKMILDEITNRLSFLNEVGLKYLTLHRNTATLSGGEAQRIRLATQIGSKLSGVLYVLDEPSIGLHQSDNYKLINTLKSLRDLNNTVIVVEHDQETILESDWVVDVGPKAGKHGGEIVYNGLVSGIFNCKKSITGQFLSNKLKIDIPKKRRKGNNKFIKIINCYQNNLKHVNVDIPLNKFVCITGVSGSGKSSLINDVVYKYISYNLGIYVENIGKVKEIQGIQNIDKIVNISQDPIGRTPRSNPATYTSVFDDIRELFTNVTDSKIRGYLKGRFSFNVTGGRCEKCRGEGSIKISMHFLPDVYIQCDDCKGKRYNSETLQIKYKGKNINDVLEMTVNEALVFFKNQIKIVNKLSIIKDVGLGYIKLGQQAPTLSGGEAQRVKLATYLQKKATGKTLFILDEPTSGLHMYDIKNLLKILNRIVDNGDSVIVIEHNLDVIKVVDYIIDLGPEGGNFGGEVIATGTPEEIANNPKSITGKYIKQEFKRYYKKNKE